MPVNNLTFNQLSTVLNSISEQATGKASITPTNTSEFVSVAQTALKTGYDPVINAISQQLSRTVFSIRPYSRKFAGIKMDAAKWGNMTRKLQIVDQDWEDDDRLTLTDGASVDMYVVKKPTVLQTNFYGANQYQRHFTVFRDQLDSAFTGPEQFGEFLAMVTGNASDLVEQAHENVARATIANFIGGKIAGDGNSVIHLLTEYNAQTGKALTSTTVYDPANYPSFIKWVYARVAALTSLMTERSQKFQIQVTGKEISRHTPLRNQKVYLYAPEGYAIDSRVLADTYHENFLKLADNEMVNFWQSIDTPDSIDVTPIYLKPDGSLDSPKASIHQDKIFGVIFDDEALGYTVVNEWAAPTAFNPRGGYYNQFLHFTDRYVNDFTEKGIVLLLD